MFKLKLYCTFINHQHGQERGRTDVGDAGNQQTGDRRWKCSDARLAKTRGQKSTEKAEKVVNTALDPQETRLRPVRQSYARAETRRSPDVQELRPRAPNLYNGTPFEVTATTAEKIHPLEGTHWAWFEAGTRPSLFGNW